MTPCTALAAGTIVIVGLSEMAKQPLPLVIKNRGVTVIPSKSQEYTLINKIFGTDGITLCSSPK